jgi:hypothetical protein
MDQDFSGFFEEFYRKQYSELTEKMSRKGDKSRRLARTLQTSILVLASLTPVLIALSAVEQSAHLDVANSLRATSIVTSSAAAIMAGIGRIFRPEDTYLNARALRNALWREHSHYRAGLHDYAASENRDALFVERVTSTLDTYNAKQNKIMQESSGIAAVAIRLNQVHGE